MPLARAIGKAIIERLAPTGLSANRIIRIASSAAGGYRRTQMLDDIRVAGQRFKNQYFIEKLKSNEITPAGLMVEHDLEIDRKYRVYGKYSYYDEIEDKYFEETKSFYTDELKNTGAWTDEWTDAFREKYEAQGQDFMGFSVTAVEHNTGYPF